MKRSYLLLLGTGLVAGSLWAQVPNPTEATRPADPDDVPVFRVTATARTMRAVNFNHRDGSTEMKLEGTALMPKANGEVKIDSKTGATKISARFNDLSPAQAQGDAFLTFVMWAVTPEGRAQNLGEVMLDGDHAHLDAATELQTFGMIVTAEPYWAVTQPSDIVVMEAVVKPGAQGTEGTISYVDAKTELIEHGAYDAALPAADRALAKKKNDAPLDLKEARHAVAIARGVSAEVYAPDTMAKANTDLQNAEAIWKSRKDTKRVQTLARNVTQLAEDARIVSLRKVAALKLDRERQEAQTKVDLATSEAERQANLRALAETEKRQAEQQALVARQAAQHEATLRAWAETQQAALAEARLEADRVLAETQAELNQTRARAKAAQAEASRQSQAAQQAAAKAAEAQRIAEMNAKAKADAEAELARVQSSATATAAELAQAQAAAEAARAEALNAKNAAERAQALQASTQADLARIRSDKEAADQRAAAAESERAELRVRLRDQLNKVLQTEDTARGLIVNVSDVLFDSGSYKLKPGAREKLAKVAGIQLTYPDLKIEVEGHTDSVGSEEMNLKLSENRAKSVREYLVEQGVAGEAVTSKGFGESQPVATNINAAGRQQNRRVELVVAGESITAKR